MLLRLSMPNHFQFRMMQDWKNVLFHQGGDIHYIGGAEILPAPLEAEEEAACIEGLSSEDPEAAKNKLVEHNLRLVVYIAKKFDNTGVGVEDLISIGTIGLIKAINTFRADKKIKLATYASRCIENEILMYLRRNSKIKMEVSIDESFICGLVWQIMKGVKRRRKKWLTAWEFRKVTYQDWKRRS